MKKNISKILVFATVIILIITLIFLFIKYNRAHIQIKSDSGEILFSEDVIFNQDPYFLNFNSDNITNFLDKNNIKDADKVIIYNDNHIIYQGHKAYLRSLENSQKWGLPGRFIKEGKILTDMFAISTYYNGHIFQEPYSKQYFLEMACVNENDPFPMYRDHK